MRFCREKKFPLHGRAGPWGPRAVWPHTVSRVPWGPLLYPEGAQGALFAEKKIRGFAAKIFFRLHDRSPGIFRLPIARMKMILIPIESLYKKMNSNSALPPLLCCLRYVYKQITFLKNSDFFFVFETF